LLTTVRPNRPQGLAPARVSGICPPRVLGGRGGALRCAVSSCLAAPELRVTTTHPRRPVRESLCCDAHARSYVTTVQHMQDTGMIGLELAVSVVALRSSGGSGAGQ
jgi:hypothetical protein